ncbi:MAG: type II CAAX endopeptidase family protein [Chloroflexota bacterium]|nr:type II CAAX endopeptidase family protein [Chloroflexota bacterium]
MEGRVGDEDGTKTRCPDNATESQDGGGLVPDEARYDVSVANGGDALPDGEGTPCNDPTSGSDALSCSDTGSTRIVPWSLLDVAIASVLFVPAGVAGSIGLGLALAWLGIVEDRLMAGVLGSALLPSALVAAGWIFGVRRHGVSAAMLGFRRASLFETAWLPVVVLAIGLSVAMVYALIVKALGIDILLPEQNLDELASFDGLARVSVFAVVSILAPLGEEVFFRAFLLTALVAAIGRLRGMILSAAIFSVAHLGIGTLFPIFVLGMLLSWLYLRTGSIWPPFVAHAAQNALALVALELPFDTPAALITI